MNDPFAFRIGQGFDIHAFAPAYPHALVQLGGIAIPAPAPLLAHSDGDVLLHALMDACLGAVALGDIGQHFPNHDPLYAGADSCKLLAEVLEKISEKNAKIINVDLTIIAETPKISPYRQAIRDSVAALLDLPWTRVNIKATTMERLGALGRQEGIGVLAVVLVYLASAEAS